MKLIALFVLFGLSISSARTIPKNGRRYFQHEEEVTTIRFMNISDDNGVLHLEDLTRPVTRIDVNIADVKLYFYTRENPGGVVLSLANLDDLKNTGYYDPSLRNVFSAHGWRSNHLSGVNTRTRQSILSLGENANFFAIDWSIPADQFYTNVVWSIPIVGGFVADYINEMMDDFQLTASDFVLVGHSLGAHVVGCVGQNVIGEVAQIVGLDPAWPLFSLAETDNRLDETDARVVHIAHSNSGFQGFLSSIGHADYFFNGGSKQPGCGPDITNSCAHGRAVDYYVESITSTGFRALLCSTYEEFLSGYCNGNREVVFGGYIVDDSIFGDFHLDTAESSPFALG